MKKCEGDYQALGKSSPGIMLVDEHVVGVGKFQAVFSISST